MDEVDSVRAEVDVGNLSVTSITEIIPAKSRDESWLSSMTLEGVKAIFKEIWKLPKQYNGNVCVVKLPQPTTLLPREKPIPKAKIVTRWEKFAQKKGIAPKRKEKLVWNTTSKDWKPQYGFKSAKNTEDNNDWMVELPNNADPNENPFAKKKQLKRENVAKNEYHRLRNISDASKTKITNMESLDKANKMQLTKSLSAAKTATASLGKFTKALPKEKIAPNRKRKFDENIPKDVKTEKESYLKILENMNKGKPKLEINEAVQMHIQKKQKRTDKPDSQNRKKRTNKVGKKNSSFNRAKTGNKSKSFKPGNKQKFKKK